MWTIRWPEVAGTNGPLELTPRNLTFKSENRKYDYCKAKFSTEIGEMLKPETGGRTGQLRDPQPVELLLDDERIAALYFKPDSVRYTDGGTHIEFYDLQESMDSGVVDMQWNEVKLRDIYEYVFEKRENDLIKEIKFALPDEAPGGTKFKTETITIDRRGSFEKLFGPERIEAYETKKMIESTYLFDTENTSPIEAIWELNELFQIQTWVDKDYIMWVGVPETLGVGHVAAPDDSRALRYSNFNVSHPREPIAMVVVEGSWVDTPGIGVDAGSFFNPWSKDGVGNSGDVRAEGFVKNPLVDIERGQTFKVSVEQAKKEALPTIAWNYYSEKMKEAYNGSVRLNPELSGNSFTDIEDIKVGDYLYVVPDDDLFDDPAASSGQLGFGPDKNDYCGQFVHNEIYIVTGVTHSVTGSEWTVTVDISMVPDMIGQDDMGLRYFNPRSDDYLTEEDVFSGPRLFEEF